MECPPTKGGIYALRKLVYFIEVIILGGITEKFIIDVASENLSSCENDPCSIDCQFDEYAGLIFTKSLWNIPIILGLLYIHFIDAYYGCKLQQKMRVMLLFNILISLVVGMYSFSLHDLSFNLILGKVLIPIVLNTLFVVGKIYIEYDVMKQNYLWTHKLKREAIIWLMELLMLKVQCIGLVYGLSISKYDDWAHSIVEVLSLLINNSPIILHLCLIVGIDNPLQYAVCIMFELLIQIIEKGIMYFFGAKGMENLTNDKVEDPFNLRSINNSGLKEHLVSLSSNI